MSRERRREMVDRQHPALSTLRQCALMGISRSSVYYRPRAPSQKGLALMKQIDKQYLVTPFYGSRRMKVWLDRQGHRVNRKRIQRLMRTMGLQAIYRRPRTSQPGPGHKVYPYLLGGMEITRANQVWAADITYIPMAKGFLYLVAIMDWYSRYVVAWRLSNTLQHPATPCNTLDADFCVEALEEALGKGKPEIFNTDQGSQFTSEAFTGLLLERSIQISMDGKGRYLDNIFVERLWRTVKYEEVYLKAYSNGREAKDGLDAYFHFYNTQRPHQALGYRTPAEVFSGNSAPTNGRSKERRWPPSKALENLGKTAGPSLNIASILSN
jgi:putative transposase